MKRLSFAALLFFFSSAIQAQRVAVLYDAGGVRIGTIVGMPNGNLTYQNGSIVVAADDGFILEIRANGGDLTGHEAANSYYTDASCSGTAHISASLLPVRTIVYQIVPIPVIGPLETLYGRDFDTPTTTLSPPYWNLRSQDGQCLEVVSGNQPVVIATVVDPAFYRMTDVTGFTSGPVEIRMESAPLPEGVFCDGFECDAPLTKSLLDTK